MQICIKHEQTNLHIFISTPKLGMKYFSQNFKHTGYKHILFLRLSNTNLLIILLSNIIYNLQLLTDIISFLRKLFNGRINSLSLLKH